MSEERVATGLTKRANFATYTAEGRVVEEDLCYDDKVEGPCGDEHAKNPTDQPSKDKGTHSNTSGGAVWSMVMGVWVTAKQHTEMFTERLIKRYGAVTLANYLAYLHYMIVAFVFGGWMCPWTKKLYALFYGVVMLNWLVNDGQCILTMAENRLRSRWGNYRVDKQSRFIAGRIQAITGIELNPRSSDIVQAVIYTVAFMFVVIRM
jgi:hypothetical protein